MGSVTRDDSSQKAIEGDLVDSGNRLFRLRKSTDGLLVHVERVESLLAKVWQKPPMSTCKSLLPAMKALMTDEVSLHRDINVQIAVGSCFNELTRITAPDFPYDDDRLMVFFRLFLTAFKQLSSNSGPNFSRALKILETMAKVRSSLILLDIDTDGGMIVEMFKTFLDKIRPSHSSDVFKYMEMIMSLVIQESDRISIDLLIPLLDSVKMENKDISPISWELGKKIFENCATKLYSCLRKAVTTMNLNIEDYDEIVAAIIHDTSLEGNMMLEQIAPAVADVASPSDEVPNANHEDFDPQAINGEGAELNAQKDIAALRRSRGKKPNSLIRPEEGYKRNWTTTGRNKYSGEASADGCSEEVKKDSTLQLKMGNGSLNEGSVLKKDQPKKKKNKNNQDNGDPGFSSMLKKKISQSKMERSQNNSKEKKSRKSRVDCGEELVNLRIQVWWPMDETFYTGTVKAFDPSTKKHTILYDDDETETLNLRKERWELFNEQNSQKREADGPSLAKEFIKTPEKSAKRKTVSSRKQNTPLSKRSKSENCSVDKSAPEIIYVNEDEACVTNVSTKDGENSASKEDSGTFMNKTEGTVECLNPKRTEMDLS